MGQRSQIYVRFNKDIRKTDKKYLVAKYFRWNYGERMVSRARGTMEWLDAYKSTLWEGDLENLSKLKAIINVNFDMWDVAPDCDIIKEYIEEDYYDAFEEVFTCQDNNDGQLLIDFGDDEIKYAFIKYADGDRKPMNPEEYMDWDYPGWELSKYIDDEGKRACKDNIQHIMDNYQLMTQEEVDEFIEHDYVSDMGLVKKDKTIIVNVKDSDVIGGESFLLGFSCPKEWTKEDFLAAVKASVTAFCASPEGKEVWQHNCREFNWRDVECNMNAGLNKFFNDIGIHFDNNVPLSSEKIEVLDNEQLVDDSLNEDWLTRLMQNRA